MKCLRYIIVIMICLVAGNEAAFAQSDRISVRMGNKYYRQQNFDKAEVEYRKALGKNPRNTQAMYNLGCALLQQQKDSAAIVQLENAGKAETSAKRKARPYRHIRRVSATILMIMKPATIWHCASISRKSRMTIRIMVAEMTRTTTRKSRTRKTMRIIKIILNSRNRPRKTR